MLNTIPKRLKVAHVIPDLDLNVTGGVGTLLRILVQCLDRDQIENVIVTFKSSASDRRFFEDLGIPVFSQLLTADTEIEPSIQISRWLMQLFQTISPDIVHMNLFWGDTLGRLAAHRVKIPVIVTTENNRNLQELSRQQAMKRKLAALTDCVVCVSKSVWQYSKSSGGISDDLLLIIYCGILLEKYKIESWNGDNQRYEFFFMARLEPQKAPLRLLDAFSVLAIEYPDCHISIVGDGSLMQDCCDCAEALELTQQVQFWGYQSEPWRYAPPGSTFVMTSDYEGHPLAVLEAMATGHLCVLPNLPEISEMVEAGTEAIVYQAGDRDSLVAALRQAVEMPVTQRLQIVKAARMRVERDFDASRMADRYLQLYQTLYAQKMGRVADCQTAASHAMLLKRGR